MFTKPKYRQILSCDVAVGMRIYSPMLGGGFPRRTYRAERGHAIFAQWYFHGVSSRARHGMA